MAIGTYELWLDHWDGTRLAYLDSMLSLEYTRVLHGVGVINLTMPSSFDTSLLQDDYKIEVWRALPGVSKRPENVYMIRGWRKWTDDAGVDKVLISGVDGNDILKRRFCLAQNSDEYDGNNDYSRKTDFAGNMIKQYMRDCLLAGYVTGNIGRASWTQFAYRAIVPYFNIQVNTNDGTSFTENRACETIFDIANGICDRSTGRGYPIYWYVYPVSGAMYELRTYTPLMGQDLSDSITIGLDATMGQAVHERDATDEFTAIFVRGKIISPKGRVFRVGQNQARWASTPFNYRELFVDAGEASRDECGERADTECSDENILPQEYLSCNLYETEALRYQREWDLGDKVSLNYRGLQSKIVIKAIQIQVGNTEKVGVVVKYEPPLEVVIT